MGLFLETHYPPPMGLWPLANLFCLISTAESSVLEDLCNYLCVVCGAENDLETVRTLLGG